MRQLITDPLCLVGNSASDPRSLLFALDWVNVFVSRDINLWVLHLHCFLRKKIIKARYSTFIGRLWLQSVRNLQKWALMTNWWVHNILCQTFNLISRLLLSVSEFNSFHYNFLISRPNPMVWPSFESSLRDDSNELSHHRVCWEIRKFALLIISYFVVICYHEYPVLARVPDIQAKGKI